MKEAGILDLKTWSTGVAILTKKLEIWVVSDLENPFCEKLADMGIFFLKKFNHFIRITRKTLLYGNFTF